MDDYIKIPNCLCCLNKNLKVIFDLGKQPLANDYHILEKESKLYPLVLMHCDKCFHSQLKHSINPEILFKSYKYVSGTSQTSLDFFKNNAKLINSKFNKIDKFVLDIACNDGSQLDCFKELGWKTFGVDPATNLYNLSSQKGHQIICDFWNGNIDLPQMDIIIAQNVFAHIITVDQFLQDCKRLMKKTSSLFIQTSQKDMFINGEFDTVYHEHISFFNINSMETLINRNGLFLNNVTETDIHGNSYIFEIKIKENYEKFNLSLFKNISDTSILNLKNIINEYRQKDYRIVGFGAAAKGQTVLCYGNIKLDYIIDENPLKIGLYTPKMNIPIVDKLYFINDQSDNYLIIIMAWNFAEEIISKIKSLKKDKCIVIIDKYLPCINLVH